MLVLASVLGREFALDALARLARVPEDELLELLDEAMRARVVTDVPGAPGRLRFAHVLIRDTLYEGLTTAPPRPAAPARRRDARGALWRRARALTSPSSRTTRSRAATLDKGAPLRPARRRSGARAARLRGGRASVRIALEALELAAPVG